MKPKLLTLFTILFSTTQSSITTRDTCSESIKLLDAKLNKVLYILESHFRTNFDNYGPGYANTGSSGNNYYAPTTTPGYTGLSTGKNSIIGGHGITGKAPSSLVGTREAGSTQAAAEANKVGGAAYVDVEKETEINAFTDEAKYLGDNVYADERGKVEAFHKGEGYGHDVSDGYTYEAEYTGTRVNDTIAALRVNTVTEQQDIEESFYNDEKRESHQGSYYGNEYDIANKFKKVDGGFSDKSDKQSVQQSAYKDVANEGGNFKDGKYNAYENHGFEDESKEIHQRERELYRPHGAHDDDLYDKFNGKKGDYASGDYGDYGRDDDKFYGDKGHGTGFGSRRSDYESSKDYDDRFYESEFNGKDQYGKNIKSDQNVGFKSEADRASQYNNGVYQDVEAVGHNKGANYKGDYYTKSDKKDAGYRFRNDEAVEEFATPDRFATLIINDNTVTFKGTEKKSGNYDEYKEGQYDEKEINKKLDNDRRQQQYRGQDFDQTVERDVETEGRYYGHKDAAASEQAFKKDYIAADKEYRPSRPRQPKEKYERRPNY